MLDFVSGLETQLIDGYEVLDANPYYIDGYRLEEKCEPSEEQVQEGSYSLKVDYDYANWDKVYNGTINIRVNSEVSAYLVIYY